MADLLDGSQVREPGDEMEAVPASTTEARPNSVPIEALRLGESPRLVEPDRQHVETLAQMDEPLPPILVHWPSMTVVDGAHRLIAARLRDQQAIEVCYVEGDRESVFVAAVKANSAHGLPLTLADRTAAAARIVRSYPAWSNRVIAGITALAASTVGAIRERESAGEQLGSRVGRDGRVRPLSTAAARELAGTLLTEQPGASLREIATAVGLAPATVRDVRERMKRGQGAAPAKELAKATGGRGTTAAVTGKVVASRRLPGWDGRDVAQPLQIVERLRRDPSLRFNEARRELLRWLGSHATGIAEWHGFAKQVPPHATVAVAAFARACARNWISFAEELERRSA
ncbi:hypothetical protein ACWY4P_45710 [Streptomyces sp. LZ34]